MNTLQLRIAKSEETMVHEMGTAEHFERRGWVGWGVDVEWAAGTGQ